MHYKQDMYPDVCDCEYPADAVEKRQAGPPHTRVLEQEILVAHALQRRGFLSGVQVRQVVDFLRVEPDQVGSHRCRQRRSSEKLRFGSLVPARDHGIARKMFTVEEHAGSQSLNALRPRVMCEALRIDTEFRQQRFSRKAVRKRDSMLIVPPNDMYTRPW